MPKTAYTCYVDLIESVASPLALPAFKKPNDLEGAITGLISFPPNFCQFTTSTNELITKVFLNTCANYKNHVW